MRKIALIVSMFIGLQVSAQDGIRFEHSSWSEMKVKAIKANKLIFIDFYTQWCGPCYNMAKEVFTLESVGNFYNQNFVNAKIDAENGEGVELAKRYGVRSYPTFVFVDPNTEEAVHVSSSRQDKETFLFTGKSALDPKLRSAYLIEQFKNGNTDPNFLLSYARYAASRYDKGTVDNIAAQIIDVKGFSLENADVWSLFEVSMSGRKSGYFNQLLKSYDQLSQLYTKERVDAKLFKEYAFCQDLKEFDLAPDFKGKDFLIQRNSIDMLIKARSFDAAAAKIEALLANPGEYKQQLCEFLHFVARGINYGEYPETWKSKCYTYAQYVAYNMPRRDDATYHFEYALMLEKIIRTIPNADKYVPESIVKKPVYGEKDYTMRPQDLKKKPTKK